MACEHLQGCLNRKKEVAAHGYPWAFTGMPLGHVRHAGGKYDESADLGSDAVKDPVVVELADEDQISRILGNPGVVDPRETEAREIAHARVALRCLTIEARRGTTPDRQYRY